MESMYTVFPSFLIGDKRFTPCEKLVILQIITLTGKDGYCRSTKKEISEVSGIGIKTVRNTLKKMKKYGVTAGINLTYTWGRCNLNT